MHLVAIRSLFPNPKLIVDKLTGQKEGASAQPFEISLSVLERACVPLLLEQMVGGKYAIENFRREIRRFVKKGRCDVDHGLARALPLWIFMDVMRAVRERAALRTLQRCFRLKKQAKAASAIEPNTEKPLPSPRVTERLNSARHLDAELNSQGDPAVTELLSSLGLKKFIKVFAAEEVDMAALKLMNEGDLKDLGLQKGPRVKVMNGIK